MKQTISAAAMLLTLAAPLAAGSLSDPVVDPTVIVTDAESSSSGASLVLALAVLLSLPVASD